MGLKRYLEVLEKFLIFLPEIVVILTHRMCATVLL